MLRFRPFAWLLCGLAGLLPHSAPAAEVSKYLPNDTEIVVTVNVKQVLDASLVKQNAVEAIRNELKNNGDISAVLEKLGFDPLRDVSSVTLALPAFEPESKKGLLIVQGKFDVPKFQAEAARVAQQMSDVLKIHKAGSETIYEVIPPDDGQNVIFVAIVDGTTAVASASKDYVAEALEKKSGKKKPAVSKDVQAMLQKSDGSQSLTLVATGNAGRALMPEARGLTGTIHVADDLRAEIRIAGQDAAAAKAINKKIIDGKNLVQLLASDNEQLAPVVELLRKIEAKVQGTDVVLSVHVPKDQIEKSIKKKQGQ